MIPAALDSMFEAGDPLEDQAAASVADVAESLMAQYECHVPLSVVSSVVLDAHRELDHQVPGDALPEMLHRLADQRLAELAAS
jgi:hypothetical protein